MKRILFLPLAIIIGFYLQQAPAFAQDQSPKQGDTKDAAGSPKARGKLHASKHVGAGIEQGAASREVQSSGKISSSSSKKALRSRSTAIQSNRSISQGVQQTNRSQSSGQQTPAFAVQGNQANHYDGHWSSASSHSDWDQQTNHRWRNHDYRWYDGGWLMIDVSSGPGYVTGGSIGANVQASLAQQGYYDGPIDGDIGRGTRRAISHYESDNGLQVNGVIDEPLLVSLRLE
jgi:hypothetical protein